MWQLIEISRVCGRLVVVIETKPRRCDRPMRLVDGANAQRTKRHVIFQNVALDRWRIAVLAFESIVEAGCQRAKRLRPSIDINRSPPHMIELSQVIDSVAVVGMVMEIGGASCRERGCK